MKTAYLPIIFGTLIALASGSVVAQESVAAANLTAAKELSAASGRPIFAIAGRKT